MEEKLIPEQKYYGTMDNSTPVDNMDIVNMETNVRMKVYEDIAGNIHSINMSCRFLEQASKAIATSRDSVKLRNSIQKTLVINKSAIDKTKEKLQNATIPLKNQDRVDRLQLDKLKNTFRDAVQAFSLIQKDVVTKLKCHSAPRDIGAAHATAFQQEQADSIIFSDEAKLLSSQEYLQKQLNIEQENIIEREDALRKIESDILDINDIMRDLGTMVNSQAQTVDLIENVVEEIHENVEGGRSEIEKAVEHQRKRKSKIIFLLVFALIVIAILAVVIYTTLNQ